MHLLCSLDRCTLPWVRLDPLKSKRSPKSLLLLQLPIHCHPDFQSGMLTVRAATRRKQSFVLHSKDSRRITDILVFVMQVTHRLVLYGHPPCLIPTTLPCMVSCDQCGWLDLLTNTSADPMLTNMQPIHHWRPHRCHSSPLHHIEIWQALANCMLHLKMACMWSHLHNLNSQLLRVGHVAGRMAFGSAQIALSQPHS